MRMTNTLPISMRAYACAATGAAAAASAALVPVPGVGEAGVFGVNVSMVVGIAAAMGVPLTRDNLSPLATSMAGALLTLLAARLAAGEVAKLIPGVGTIAGGLINAGIAGPATYGLGCAFTEYLCRFHAQHSRMPEGPEISEGFKKFWEHWREKEKPPPGESSS